MMIAYYRCSTKRQGRSGLGLEAQKKTVQDFIHGDKRRKLIAEYKDIESGRNDHRPELKKAIDHAKKVGATLLIAKLDRLSRNVSFIFTLRDSEVDFRALDLPDMNTMTVGIFASVAQHEREVISQRIKDALAARRRRGQELGNNNNLTDEGRIKGAKRRSEYAAIDENNIKATAMIELLRKDGKTYRAIAERLNELRYKTTTGKQFESITVQRLFKRSKRN